MHDQTEYIATENVLVTVTSEGGTIVGSKFKLKLDVGDRIIIEQVHNGINIRKIKKGEK